ncbi:MAG: TrmB family transcriptional regulator [Candidatus Dojkabacteria bacterium]
MFVEDFTKIGLNKGEAEIYDSLLQFGSSSASELAKKTDIGRTNVYEYANGLVKKGLATQIEKSNKIFFRAENPKLLRDLAQKQLREAKEITSSFSSLLPRIEELYNKNVSKPLIVFYQGASGYNELMEKIYLETEDCSICHLVPDLDLYTPPEPKYRNTFIRKNIFTNLIANKGEAIGELNKRDKRALRRTIVVPAKDFAIKQDMVLFEDNIAFGDLSKDSFSATLIKNDGLTKLLKSLCTTLMRS